MKKDPKEEPEKEAAEKPKKPRVKKTVEYEGSRWLSIWLLIATIIAGWLFSVVW